MNDYQQDYNFSIHQLNEKECGDTLSTIDENAINKITVCWALCAIIFYAYPIVCSAVYYVSSEFFTFTFIDVIDVYLEYVYNFDSWLYAVIALIRGALFIAMQALAIVGRIKYPKSQKINTVFKIDMAMLVIVVIFAVIIFIQIAAFCAMCEDCG